MLNRTIELKEIVRPLYLGKTDTNQQQALVIADVDCQNVIIEKSSSDRQRLKFNVRARYFCSCCQSYSPIHDITLEYGDIYPGHPVYLYTNSFKSDILKMLIGQDLKSPSAKFLVNACSMCQCVFQELEILYANPVNPIYNNCNIIEHLTQEVFDVAGFPKTVRSKITQDYEQHGYQILRGVNHYHVDPKDLTIRVEFTPQYACVRLKDRANGRHFKINEDGSIETVSQQKLFIEMLHQETNETGFSLIRSNSTSFTGVKKVEVYKCNVGWYRRMLSCDIVHLNIGNNYASRIGLAQYFDYLAKEQRRAHQHRSHQDWVEHLNRYYRLLKDYPAVELLMKAGYGELIEEIVTSGHVRNEYSVFLANQSIADRHGTAPDKIFNIPKATLKRLRQMGISLTVDQVRALRRLCTIRPLLAGDLDELTDNVSFEHLIESCSSIARLLHYGYTYRELLRYADRMWLSEVLRPSETFIYLADYNSMCQDMDVPAEKTPRGLRVQHDIMQRNYKYKKDEIMDKCIARRAEELSCLAYQADGFEIVLPTCAEDIVREGQTLCHCVASYVDRVAKGSTTILFLRRLSDPTRPYMTIEWHEGRLTQIKSKHNGSLHAEPKETQDFFKKWLKYAETQYLTNGKLPVAA